MCEKAPLFDDLTDGPRGGAACWLHTPDGVRIRSVFWNCANMGGDKGTVLIFPGRTEYAEKYGRAANELLARGFSSLAIDWRGQGLAERLLDDTNMGHVGAFRDYQRDVEAVLEEARRRGMPEPFFLIAHSMGGCIGLRSLMEGLPVRAAVFSAPMWNIQMALVMRPVAWVVGHAVSAMGAGRGYAPGTSQASYVNEAPFDDNTLTTDPEMWDYMKAQAAAHPEMALGGPSVHWVHESLSECRALERMPSPNIPTICFLGSNERIVDPRPIRKRMANWPGGRLEMIEGAEHEVMMERPPIRNRVFDQSTELFKSTLQDIEANLQK